MSSNYQFIDRCNFSTLDNQLNLFIFYSHIAKDQEKSSYQLRLIEGNSINDMAYHNKLQLAKIYGDLQDDEKAIF
jgi:hypothetical protein